MANFGWAHVVGAAISSSEGPVNSLQFKTGDTNISGSSNLTFLNSSNELKLTGSLFVNGTIQASNYQVTTTVVSQLSSSGSSKFGNTADDNHQFTGSVQVSGNVGVGTGSPTSELHLASDLTTKPIFTIENSNGDAVASSMNFVKSTAGVAASDQIGIVAFKAKNVGGTLKPYSAITGSVVTTGNGSHDGAIDFRLSRNGAEVTALKLYGNANGGAVFNESGNDNFDFRIESTGEDEAIFLDSSENTLYINKGETAFTTIIGSIHDEAIRVSAVGVVLNEDGHATNDFRVESDSKTHMLFVDSGNNRIGVGASVPSGTLGIDGDIYLQPTAISTSHIVTVGSLDIRASNNIKIGTDGADSIRVGRTNTALAKVFIRSGADNDLVVSNSKVGIGVEDPDQALEVGGIVHISTEQGSSPSAPSDGDGGLLYVKADGKPYWRSNEISEIALTDYPTVANGVDNRIATFSAATALNGEANLTFDGSLLYVSGGMAHKRVQKTTNYTLAASDYIVGVNTTSNVVTCSLPAASAVEDGQMFVIKDEGGNAGSNDIRVVRNGSDTIDGGTFALISSPYGAINLYSDGTNKWFIF